MTSCVVRDTTIELVRGDIVEQHVDAVVNAANSRLAGGSGVDGAIHRAGGPSILEACRALPEDDRGRRCPTGEARTTHAGSLPARYVIHAVGPVYDERHPDRSADRLRSTYRAALHEAVAHDCRTVAFPAISAGAYRFPLEDAARIAIESVAAFIHENDRSPSTVRFVLFSDAVYAAFHRALAGRPSHD